MKKMNVFFTLFILFYPVFMLAQSKDIESWNKFQLNIDKAKTDTEKFKMLAEALLEDIKKRVKDILKKEEWESLGLTEKQIIFTVNYKRPSEIPDAALTKEPFPLEAELCRRISQDFIYLLFQDQFLKDYLVLLYENLDDLKGKNVQSGNRWIRNDHKKEPGLFKDTNSFFEILLDINRSNDIVNISGRMVSVRTRDIFMTTASYDLTLKTLIEKYDDQPFYNVSSSQLKPSNIDKIQPLVEITTYYEAPGENRKKINSGEIVESGGIIWFEITLPELGGYLLVYSKDKTGKTFNLFPGTSNAILNGDYRVPYNLNNPYTEIQRIAAENTINAKLPLNKIIIGGYTFDSTPGDEIFYFYYTNERNDNIEHIMINSRNTRGNIPMMKGILENSVIPFDHKQIGAKIGKPVFYIKELKQFFKYK